MGGVSAAGIVDTDLLHAGHSIGSGPQHGGQGDGVARLQGMDFPEVIVHPSVMSGEAGISIPDAGVGEVAGTLLQRGAVRPLVDLDGEVDSGDLQGSQAAVAVVEIACHLGVSARGAALGDIGGAAAGDLGHGDCQRQ